MNRFLNFRYMSPDDAGGDGGSGDDGDNSGGDEEVKPFYSSLGENWRDDVVSSLGLENEEDIAKRTNQMSRFSSFEGMAKSMFDAQDKIRAGQVDRGLPENATDEQLADYRQANGIPETHEGYELKLDEGLVLGEDDTRVMQDVFKVAHDSHIPTDVMSQMTNAMLNARQNEVEQMMAKDGLDKQQAEKMTKELWGADYEANTNLITGMISGLSEEVRESLENARLSNGQALFNSPEILSLFSDAARALNPAATITTNSNYINHDEEIAALEARMGDDDWHNDVAANKRYDELIENKLARERK